MKGIITVTACFLLFCYGAKVATLPVKQNTITAAGVNPTTVLPKTVIRDTITTSDTIRDTVSQIKYKIKYKTKRVPYTRVDTIVSNDTLNSRRIRKETSPDTMPSKAKWYYRTDWNIWNTIVYSDRWGEHRLSSFRRSLCQYVKRVSLAQVRNIN